MPLTLATKTPSPATRSVADRAGPTTSSTAATTGSGPFGDCCQAAQVIHSARRSGASSSMAVLGLTSRPGRRQGAHSLGTIGAIQLVSAERREPVVAKLTTLVAAAGGIQAAERRAVPAEYV